MSFEERLTKSLPNYEEILTSEDLIELRNIFDSAQVAYNRASNLLNKQLNNKVGLDYTNDYEKAMAFGASEMSRFEERITEIVLREKSNEKEKLSFKL